MILGFATKFPSGKLTNFQNKILAGVGRRLLGNRSFEYYPSEGNPENIKLWTPKIHTLRQGSRWRAGMSIQMATGVRTNKYEQWNVGIEGLDVCNGVQEIKISIRSYLISPSGTYHSPYCFFILGNTVHILKITVDGRPLKAEEQMKLIMNDGFDNHIEFMHWFKKPFTGQIIHWTRFKY